MSKPHFDFCLWIYIVLSLGGHLSDSYFLTVKNNAFVTLYFILFWLWLLTCMFGQGVEVHRVGSDAKPRRGKNLSLSPVIASSGPCDWVCCSQAVSYGSPSYAACLGHPADTVLCDQL